MRDPNRLYEFYIKMMQLHMEYMSDLRFGQFMMCFMDWYKKEYKEDVFYLEEKEFYKRLRDYVMENAYFK